MVHISGGAEAEVGSSRRRARRREATLDRMVSTALAVVSAEGLEALTIQRLAKELDVAVGGIYRYFSSKDAIVAALQCRVLGSLAERLDRAWATLAVQVARAGAEPRIASLAALTVAADVYRRIPTTDPAAFRLLGMTIGDPRVLLSDEDGRPVLEAVLPLFVGISGRFDDAERTGALAPGDTARRAIALWAGVHGVLSMAKLGRFEPLRLDTDATAIELVEALLRGWGARAEDLRAARTLIEEGSS